MLVKNHSFPHFLLFTTSILLNNLVCNLTSTSASFLSPNTSTFVISSSRTNNSDRSHSQSPITVKSILSTPAQSRLVNNKGKDKYYSYRTHMSNLNTSGSTNDGEDFDININTSKAMDKSKMECIRVETQPDPCLNGFSSPAHVWGKIEEVRSFQNRYTNSSLYLREWIDVDCHVDGNTDVDVDANVDVDTCGTQKINEKHHSFTVMQFNTLAEGLSSGPTISAPFEQSLDDSKKIKDTRKAIFGGFTEIPNPEISLDFNLRRWRIIEVLLGFGYSSTNIDGAMEEDSLFDIIAMEEVDRYHGFYMPILKLFGYDGIFAPKPYSPGVKSGWYSDGCALFWKKDTFDLIDEVRRSFDTGTQVFIIATLRHRESGRIIVVTATHLKAQKNSANEKIRTIQANQLVECTEDIVKKAASDANIEATDIPIVLMGDFNAEPDGEGNTCIKSILSKKPQFYSAYNLERGDFFTTWKTRGDETSRRIIDYIFHNCKDTKKGLRCTQVLDISKEEEIEATKLPGFRHPSDHMNIAARFVIE
jgi:mRNA deadenylase 3'-5' endonuclease subunit Ccr4